MDYSLWEEEVREYESREAPAAPIVFYGSSTMRMWESLRQDFPVKPVVNRGFGGSNVDQAAHFVPRLITPLKPKQIVFYSGENDLAQEKSVEQIQLDYETLLIQVRTAVETPLVILSVKPSWGRWALKPQMDELNIWLRSWCAREAGLTFVDVVGPMLENGEPRRELLIEDGVHLSPLGYRLWTEILRPHLI